MPLVLGESILAGSEARDFYGALVALHLIGVTA